MKRAPRSAADTLRKVVAAILLVPLAILIIAFAVANRQVVTVSFDPFSSSAPAASMALPLFVLIIVLLIAGVAIGGVASWLRHAKWRRIARRLEREVDTLRGTAGGPKIPQAAEPPAPPERLQLRAPLH